MIDRIRRQMASWFQKEKTTVKKKQPSASYTQRDMFFANMSHEIRTPVNGIVGFTQLLKETKLDKEQDELVNTIHASSMHLLGLVNDILDFSKINAHKMTLEETEFDLFRQVEDTIETYAAVAQEKGIALELYIDPVISPTLIGDPSKLSQVLINLVSNAMKFTDALGRVDVSVEKVMEGQKMVTLRFSVQDTGIGISPGAQKNIFNAFAQANSSISRKFGGTGLGLAISSELVKLMGGELVVDSAPDEGSEFSFTLAFEKVRSQERRVYADFYRGLSAGIVLAQKGQNRSTEKNLKAYLSYLGMDVHLYSSVEIVSMNTNVLPDLLFADDHLAGIPLKELSEMDVKFIPLSSLNGQNGFPDGYGKHCEGIYKPVNLTKTIRALEGCLGDASAAKEEAAAVNRNFKGFRALVVDDNRVNQKLMMRVLENMQMDVELAFDGEEALEYCQSIDFDIIFMDIQMPVMDGVEATRKIVAWEQSQGRDHTPIIALTGNADSEDMQVYMDAGMDGFMAKPVDVNIMLSYLNKYTVAKKLVHQMDRQEVTFPGAKALIVEENSINQKLIERALVSRGVVSTLISRASILMDTYRKEPFNIVFISAGMPMVNVSEVIREMRLYEMKNNLHAVPVVVIVPKDTSEIECSDYRVVGANGCLFKPLDIDEIKQELDRCIRYDRDSVEKEEVHSPSIVEEVSSVAVPLSALQDEEEEVSSVAEAEEERDMNPAEEEGDANPAEEEELIPLLKEDAVSEQDTVISLKDTEESAAETDEAEVSIEDHQEQTAEKHQETESEEETFDGMPESPAEEQSIAEDETAQDEESSTAAEGMDTSSDALSVFETHMVKKKTLQEYEEAMLELKEDVEEIETPEEEAVVYTADPHVEEPVLLLVEEEVSVPVVEETDPKEAPYTQYAQEAESDSDILLLSEEKEHAVSGDTESRDLSAAEEAEQTVEAVEGPEETESPDTETEEILRAAEEKAATEENLPVALAEVAHAEQILEVPEETEMLHIEREEKPIREEEKAETEETLSPEEVEPIQTEPTEEAEEKLGEREISSTESINEFTAKEEREEQSSPETAAMPEIESEHLQEALETAEEQEASIPEPEEESSPAEVPADTAEELSTEAEETEEAVEAVEVSEAMEAVEMEHEEKPVDEEESAEAEEIPVPESEVLEALSVESEEYLTPDTEPSAEEAETDASEENSEEEISDQDDRDTEAYASETDREDTRDEGEPSEETAPKEEVEVVKIGETRHVVQYIDIPFSK